MGTHIICILIVTTLIFKRWSIHSWVEAHSSSWQLLFSVQKLSASSPSYCLFLFTLGYASVFILSTSSPYYSFMPHFSLCLFAPLLPFYFLFINSLFRSLYSSSVSHFSLLSPQALCCSSSSAVITAVLFTVCCTILCLLNLFQQCRTCEESGKFWVSTEQPILPKCHCAISLLHPSASLLQYGH